MDHDIKILDSITETADMSRDSLKHVIDKAENSQLKEALKKQFSQYNQTCEQAETLLLSKGKQSAKKPPAAIKMYAHIVSDFKTATAKDSTSQIAEMVIQGSTMGVTEMTKQLNNYCGNDVAVRNLAERHVKNEQENIEEMKKYL